MHSGVAHVIHHLLEMGPGIRDIGGESLEESAIDAVLAHPGEMSLDGLGVLRGEDASGGSIGVAEGRGDALIRIQVGGIGPHINTTDAGFKFVIESIVPPDPVSGLVLGSEPALIADEDFALHCLGDRGISEGVAVEGGDQKDGEAENLDEGNIGHRFGPFRQVF